jgi:hypothetical protein
MIIVLVLHPIVIYGAPLSHNPAQESRRAHRRGHMAAHRLLDRFSATECATTFAMPAMRTLKPNAL